MIRLIELEGIMLKKIDKGEIKHDMPEDYLLKVKQFILLDALAKIMMLIEGTMILCFGLSSCKKTKISRLMSRYQTKHLEKFIKRLENGQVDIWKLLALPSLEKLQKNCGLTDEEREKIRELFNESCNAVKKTLSALIKFYEKNKIVYWKFKHGLSIITGFKLIPKKNNGLPPLLWAIDRLSRKPSFVCLEVTNLLPLQLLWFNTISILFYSEKTFQHYSSILSDLRMLVKYIVNNQILWAINCGEDYFPMEKQLNGVWAPTIYVTSDILKKCELVIPKITKNTYVVDSLLDFRFTLKGKALEKVVQCLQRDNVVTIWSPNMAKSKIMKKCIQ